MNRKNSITLRVLEAINPNFSEKDFKKAKHSWWTNPRTKDTGGLQLTREGFDALASADIKYYKIRMEDWVRVKDAKTILWLDKYINCPFYFDRFSKSVWIFDEQTAVQLMLFSGNIIKMVRAVHRFKEKSHD